MRQGTFSLVCDSVHRLGGGEGQSILHNELLIDPSPRPQTVKPPLPKTRVVDQFPDHELLTLRPSCGSSRMIVGDRGRGQYYLVMLINARLSGYSCIWLLVDLLFTALTNTSNTEPEWNRSLFLQGCHAPINTKFPVFSLCFCHFPCVFLSTKKLNILICK